MRETRERLEALPLVKSASVRKLYPDELVDHPRRARRPRAVAEQRRALHHRGRRHRRSTRFDEPRFADLPLVVGEQANLHTKDYLALLEAAGPLKSRIRAGTLVSGRRWTLKMDNGMDVRLPEHGAPGRAAAPRQARARAEASCEKDVIAIDLRMPDRVVVRLTEEAAAARAEALKKKPMRGKGVET